jgi:hypothetical protein
VAGNGKWRGRRGDLSLNYAAGRCDSVPVTDMCDFISIAVPEASAAAVSQWRRRGYKLSKQDNPTLKQMLPHGFAAWVLTTNGCSCAMCEASFASAADSDAPQNVSLRDDAAAVLDGIAAGCDRAFLYVHQYVGDISNFHRAIALQTQNAAQNWFDFDGSRYSPGYLDSIDVEVRKGPEFSNMPMERSRESKKSKAQRMSPLKGWALFISWLFGLYVGWLLLKLAVALLAALTAKYLFGADWGNACVAGIAGYFILPLAVGLLDAFRVDLPKKKRRKRTD